MSHQSASLAIAIPTKDRPDDLDITIESVLNQTVLPKQLIIVDQSGNDESQRRITARYEALQPEIREWLQLEFVRDVSISGASEARNRALSAVTAEIVLFLDDDVILERDFNERILEAYRDRPEAVGISGVITNPWRNPFTLRCWMSIFMRGIFRDDFHSVYLRAHQIRESGPVKVSRLTGCLMSFPVAAIRTARFDEKMPGRWDGEDIDFCMQLWPKPLFITPRARLVHKKSPIGRSGEGWLFGHARAMWYLYQRNWKIRLVWKLSFAWLNVGYLIIATFASLRRLSIEPWRAFMRGAEQGINAGRGNRQQDLTPPQRVRPLD